jgi:flagellar L-ring protein precursor FlgH
MAMTLLRAATLLALVVAAAALGGCNALTRLNQIGEAPPLTTIQDPSAQPGYRPISLAMPAPMTTERRPNSLWQSGTRAFFKDQRAAQVGDILTLVVDINENAKLNNETVRLRNNTEAAGIPNLLGFERNIQRILPSTSDPNNLVSANSASNSDGKGTIDRKEQIKINVAALVTQVLPNGNLVVQGRQEMRVNYEVRELQVTGVIRPQDISSVNTISLDKLAEARVSYGGRGQITDVQQPRYGQQLFDIILPF